MIQAFFIYEITSMILVYSFKEIINASFNQCISLHGLGYCLLFDREMPMISLRRPSRMQPVSLGTVCDVWCELTHAFECDATAAWHDLKMLGDDGSSFLSLTNIHPILFSCFSKYNLRIS